MTTSDDLTVLGALAEPSRRALYDHVAAADSPVSREQAAQAFTRKRYNHINLPW